MNRIADRRSQDCRLSTVDCRLPSDFLLRQLAALLGLEPRRRACSELRDQVQVEADQRGDQARDQQHVDRVEAADGRPTKPPASGEEVGKVWPDYRPGGVNVHGTTVAQKERWSNGSRY